MTERVLVLFACRTVCCVSGFLSLGGMPHTKSVIVLLSVGLEVEWTAFACGSTKYQVDLTRRERHPHCAYHYYFFP
jgi:hypothetical protein